MVCVRVLLLNPPHPSIGSRIPDDYDAVERKRLPIHKRLLGNRDYSADDIKWILYARRQIGDAFSVCGIVGRDHLRIPANEAADWDREENLRGPDAWYYMLKLSYGF